ncbi:hypothetical protein BGZ51_005033, partial [Haplosporangium sp. Z 767]
PLPMRDGSWPQQNNTSSCSSISESPRHDYRKWRQNSSYPTARSLDLNHFSTTLPRICPTLCCGFSAMGSGPLLLTLKGPSLSAKQHQQQQRRF